jgi:hypothetical protein
MNASRIALLRHALVPLVAFAFACDPPAEDRVSEAQIAAYLAARGFDVATLEVLDDEVVVEHDMSMPRPDLDAKVLAWARADSPRAYAYEETIDDPAHICVEWTDLWIDAPGDVDGLLVASRLFDAAEYWSQNSSLMRAHVNLRMDHETDDCGGGTIEAYWDDLGAADASGFIVLGRGEVANGGHVGTTLRLNNNQAALSAWSDPQLTRALIAHELGHNLGFAHPEDAGDADVDHISGTSSGTDYWTVMHADLTHAKAPGVPSTDDIKGLAKTYGDSGCFDHEDAFDRNKWDVDESSTACSEDCPCTTGQGDCDSDAECAAGLYCKQSGDDLSTDEQKYYGYSNTNVDLCAPTPDFSDKLLDADDAYQLGDQFECADLDGSLNVLAYCGEGTGDCGGSDRYCAPGHECASNIGWVVGESDGMDLCRRVTKHTGACSSTDKCGLGMGACTANNQCLPGLECRTISGHGKVCAPKSL